jgi:hypothetical protein
MRALLIVSIAWLAVGCGDDTTAKSGGGADLSAQASGADLAVAVPDLSVCMFRSFSGYPGTNETPLTFDCSCGCMIDAFDNNTTNGDWGSSTQNGASFVPMMNVGLGMALASSAGASSSMPSLASLASEGPTARFFLDGDFDLQVDYDLNATAPPGESHLVLGLRKPNTVQGLAIYEVERAREPDGSQAYSSQLGGVPAVQAATTATHGTLRITRAGFTVTSFADGQKVSTLIAQDTGRLEVTLAGELSGCLALDGGTTCGYEPSWHHLQLNQGTLVNQP